MKYVVCLHLYISWKFGERGSTPRGARGPSLSVFFCPSRYVARHRKPRLCVYALNLGGTGISPPDKRHPRTIFVSVLVFVFVLVLVLVTKAATYSIAAVAGNWTILVQLLKRVTVLRTETKVRTSVTLQQCSDWSPFFGYIADEVQWRLCLVGNSPR